MWGFEKVWVMQRGGVLSIPWKGAGSSGWQSQCEHTGAREGLVWVGRA